MEISLPIFCCSFFFCLSHTQKTSSSRSSILRFKKMNANHLITFIIGNSYFSASHFRLIRHFLRNCKHMHLLNANRKSQAHKVTTQCKEEEKNNIPPENINFDRGIRMCYFVIWLNARYIFAMVRTKERVFVCTTNRAKQNSKDQTNSTNYQPTNEQN